MSTAAPLERPFLLDELDDHLDPDLDEDLRRMSFETMNALDSLTDEVDAMEQKVEAASKPPKLNARSSFEDGGGGEMSDDGRRDDSTSEQQGPNGPLETRKWQLRHIDDVVLSDGEDDDGMSLDGSIARELDDLRMVAQEIEKELQFQDSGTMEEAIASLQNPVVDDPTRRILTSDDHEIIRRVLYNDMKNYEPKNSWEHFMKRYHLQGFSDRDKTYGLSAICTVIWSIVIFLVFQVKYGEMV